MIKKDATHKLLLVFMQLHGIVAMENRLHRCPSLGWQERRAHDWCWYGLALQADRSAWTLGEVLAFLALQRHNFSTERFTDQQEYYWRVPLRAAQLEDDLQAKIEVSSSVLYGITIQRIDSQGSGSWRQVPVKSLPLFSGIAELYGLRAQSTLFCRGFTHLPTMTKYHFQREALSGEEGGKTSVKIIVTFDET